MRQGTAVATATIAALALLLAAPAHAGNGIFSTHHADPSTLRSLGFDYGMAPAYRDNLDRFWASGLKTMVWLGGYSQSTCSFNWSDAKVEERIAEIKDHPGIYAYLVDDEPHAGPECSDTPDQVRARSDLVRRLDPGTTTVITENRPDSFAPLANTTDVMGLVIYPCNVRLNGCDWNKIPERVKLAEDAGVKRYLGVTQTAGDEYYKRPSPSELERLIGQWRATRAEGDFAYTWDCCGEPLDGLAEAPDLWDPWRRENGSSLAEPFPEASPGE